jgi:hypothetical protein
MAIYDRQLIAAFLSNGQNGELIPAQAQALDGKERVPPLATEIVSISPALYGAGLANLSQALDGKLRVAQPITRDSRVYLVGEGDWRQQKLSGWSPGEVADLLGQAGMPAVKVVSIVADSLGRSSDDSLRLAFPDSFASAFHRILKETWHIRTTVHARVVDVVVSSGTEDSSLPGYIAKGRKLTAVKDYTGSPSRQSYHQPQSKVAFSWNGDVQHTDWKY